MPAVTWIWIFLCLTQSALFSGLTIGLFGLSRLRLEVQAEAGDQHARKILRIRKDANHLLATLLWGNVAVNVLLTLLTDSILSGVAAFASSTFLITIFGEIMPQAFLARHAAHVGGFLVPFVWFYQILLYPIAKPTAFLLDLWLGKEPISYFREDEFKVMLKKHARSPLSEIGRMEAQGAVNFLALDDVKIEEEGEAVDPASVVALPVESGVPVFPRFRPDPRDPFLEKLQASGKKWIVVTDPSDGPVVVLQVNRFLRDTLFRQKHVDPLRYCHRPVVVTAPGTKLGNVLRHFKVYAERPEEDVIEHDLILYWGLERRILTGADILGRLLRGISTRTPEPEKIGLPQAETAHPLSRLWARVAKYFTGKDK